MVLLIYPVFLYAQEGFYTREPMVIPVHTQNNQLHLSAGYGGGYGLAASYALTSRIAFFSYAAINQKSSRSFSIIGKGAKTKRDNYSMTGGVGFLVNPTNPNFKVEVLAGGGTFKVKNDKYSMDDLDAITYAEYWKVFGQLNLIRVKEQAEFGGAVRVPYNQYKNFYYDEVFYAPDGNRRYENIWSINIEPVGSYTVKYRNVKLNIQAGLSLPVIKGKPQVYLIDYLTQSERLSENKSHNPDLDGFVGSVSLQYNFNFRSKGKE